MKYLISMKISDDHDWLNKTIKGQKKNVHKLELMYENLRYKYIEYSNLIEEQENLEYSNFLTYKDILKDFYEHPPKELKALIKQRRHDHGLTECPYCGNPIKPDTLDHFIPKTPWPEYSIYPNNLVPQCRGCAPIKGDEYYCKSSDSVKFIHPIFSDLLENTTFKITVDFNITNNQPSFNIKLITSGMDEFSVKRVLLHAEKLKFKERILKFCYEEYYAWKAKLSSKKFDIKDALNQRINEKPDNDLCKDWKTALYKGFLNQVNLITYLNSLQPSGNSKVVLAAKEEKEHEL